MSGERDNTYRSLMEEGIYPTCERVIDDPSHYEADCCEMQRSLSQIPQAAEQLGEQQESV